MKGKPEVLLWIGSRLKGQRGLTLIELMIVLVIGGLVVGSVATTIFQIITNSARSNNYNTAVRQVQNAGMWLSQDIQMAENITPGASDGFPLTLNWGEFDGSVNYTIEYDIDEYDIENKKLKRDYTDTTDPSTHTITTVAQYIGQPTGCILSGDELYGYLVTCNITAEVGTDEQTAASETREYEIRQRPHSVY